MLKSGKMWLDVGDIIIPPGILDSFFNKNLHKFIHNNFIYRIYCIYKKRRIKNKFCV
jgi:hypothetical protein